MRIDVKLKKRVQKKHIADSKNYDRISHIESGREIINRVICDTRCDELRAVRKIQMLLSKQVFLTAHITRKPNQKPCRDSHLLSKTIASELPQYGIAWHHHRIRNGVCFIGCYANRQLRSILDLWPNCARFYYMFSLYPTQIHTHHVIRFRNRIMSIWLWVKYRVN